MDRQVESALTGGGSHRSLRAAKTEEAQRNEHLVLEVLANGGLTPVPAGELARRTGLPARTVTAVVTRLERKGLAVRDGKRGAVATAAGRIELGAGLPGTGLIAALDAAIRLLPAEALGAFTRLMLSAVVARHHLRQRYDDGWSGFVAVGPTKSGKSTTGQIVSCTFGLDWTGRIERLVGTETDGSLWGRRERVGAAWTFDPSPVLAMPFVCLTEVDKADAALRKVVYRFLQGKSVVAGEGGERIEVAPTVLVCSNAGVGSLPAEYRRRSVVLDTGSLGPLTNGIDAAARRLFAGALPRLSLDALRPPADALPDDVYGELVDQAHHSLSEPGRRHLTERAVERLAIGRAALMGAADLRRAALATVADYWACAMTVGEAADRLPATVVEALGGQLTADPGAALTEVAARRTPVMRGATEDVALVETRARWAAGFRETARQIERVPPTDRPAAAGLRAALRRLAERAGDQRSHEGLREVVALAVGNDAAPGPLPRAKALRARIDRDVADQQRADETAAREREAARATRRRQSGAARETRRFAKANAQAVKGAVIAELDRLMPDLKALEALYRRTGAHPRDARPLDVLTRLRMPTGAQVVELRKPAPAATLRDVAARAFYLPRGWWVSTIDEACFVAVPRTGADVLATWGNDTRRLLAPAIRHLQEREDGLRAAAGRAPRRSRPAVG